MRVKQGGIPEVRWSHGGSVGGSVKEMGWRQLRTVGGAAILGLRCWCWDFRAQMEMVVREVRF